MTRNRDSDCCRNGKIMVRERRKLPKWTGILYTNDAKVSEYFARFKGQRWAEKKVLPLVLWWWHVTAGQAECHHCPMVNLLKLSIAGYCSTSNNYLSPHPYWFTTSFQARAVIRQEHHRPWVCFHQKSPSIDTVAPYHKNYGFCTIFTFGVFFSPLSLLFPS